MQLRNEVTDLISRHKNSNNVVSPTPHYMSFNDENRPMSVEPRNQISPSNFNMTMGAVNPNSRMISNPRK